MNYYGGQNLANSWRTVRNNTIQIAEEIPADQYGFRATPDSMSVAELLAHMVSNTMWMLKLNLIEKRTFAGAQDFGAIVGEARASVQSLVTKEQIVDALKLHSEEFARALEAVSDDTLAQEVELPGGKKTRFEMLLSSKEHEMHHRAQLMVSQRLLGLVPHTTRSRQERMAAMATVAKQS